MSKTLSAILIFLCFIAMGIMAYTNYAALPSQIPTHWNINGDIDQYGPKDFTLYGIPALCLLMVISFWFIPAIGSSEQKNRYAQFAPAWRAIQVILVVFFTYLYGIVIYATLDPSLSMNRLMIGGFGGLLFFLGNYMGKLKQNAFVGIKVPWVYGSEIIWNKTHRMGGWLMVVVGLALVVSALVNFYNPPLAFIGIMAAFIIPVIYSFFLARNSGNTY